MWHGDFWLPSWKIFVKKWSHLPHLTLPTWFTVIKIRGLLYILVGAFNPSEKYWSNWIIPPGRGENKKCLKPPPSVPIKHHWKGYHFKPVGVFGYVFTSPVQKDISPKPWGAKWTELKDLAPLARPCASPPKLPKPATHICLGPRVKRPPKLLDFAWDYPEKKNNSPNGDSWVGIKITFNKSRYWY